MMPKVVVQIESSTFDLHNLNELLDHRPLPPQEAGNTQIDDIAEVEKLQRLDTGKQITLTPISLLGNIM